MASWIPTGPKAAGVHMDPVYWRSVGAGAAFVSGKYFSAGPDVGKAMVRLNFTTAPSMT